ncbi:MULTISPECIES: cytochrome c oxidase accessory protein CcoG [unclassified Paludibacterium]|uniref:cytochrome c oxidase accessory protein CcoG n=1 Tax=unclassified Paludibacterium TaxID=2618429 RepID=UPI001C03F736|nr:cytochrome c oxidase accessory protein CcoG [Paludibacterium sp. B53371]BEV72324.1 cytochrome c oxidase accessory protein CcoG [Paludibacterium sp. THUN1379]
MATPLQAQPIKLYPRLTSGRFNRWRVGLVLITQALFFLTPWLDWQGRQAVRFDFVSMRGYLFGLTLLPGDLIYLAGTLILCALGLFLWTALAGRLWCGFSCPQTVYSQIMLWIERWIEGPPAERRRRDAAPWSAGKLARKSLTQALMLAFSLLTGWTLVGYFSPMRELAPRWFNGGAGQWEWLFALGYAGFTWLLAGHLRESVCKHMCPYARFQSAMFDADTLLVTYDTRRGEPRGSLKSPGKGACVDCGLCVQVCPTGIDIRQGLQYECIGCAACIDACDQVMDKIGRPRGLIRLDRLNPETPQARTLWQRPRVLVYSALLGTLVAMMVWGLAWREPFRVDVLRDRAVMARETPDGLIENVYTLRIQNTRPEARQYALTVRGSGVVRTDLRQPLRAPADGSASVQLAVIADPSVLAPGSHPLQFELVDQREPGQRVSEAARLLMP